MADQVAKKPTTVLELNDGTEIHFTVTREEYIKFTNEMQPQKKYPAMFNLLMATVHVEHKEKLGKILQDNPPSVIEYCGYVMDDYKPDIAVTVKKRNGLLVD